MVHAKPTKGPCNEVQRVQSLESFEAVEVGCPISYHLGVTVRLGFTAAKMTGKSLVSGDLKIFPAMYIRTNIVIDRQSNPWPGELAQNCQLFLQGTTMWRDSIR